MLYINDSPEILADELYFKFLALLPEEQKNKTMRLRNISDRKRSVAAYTLLYEGLKSEYGINVFPELAYTENGKPELRQHPDIFFSLSHCEKGVTCIISDSRVGVDIETIKPFDAELAEYICSESELEEIMGSAYPALAFTVLWTKKESFCKMTGEGLPSVEELKQMLTELPDKFFNTIVNKEKGYVLTSCIRENVKMS